MPHLWVVKKSCYLGCFKCCLTFLRKRVGINFVPSIVTKDLLIFLEGLQLIGGACIMKNLPDLFLCQWRSDGAWRIAVKPKHEPAFFCMIDMAMKNEGINIFGGEGFTVPIDITRSLILFTRRSGFAMKSLFRKNDSP